MAGTKSHLLKKPLSLLSGALTVLVLAGASVNAASPRRDSRDHDRDYRPSAHERHDGKRKGRDGRYYSYGDYLNRQIEIYRRQALRERYLNDPRAWDERFPWMGSSSMQGAIESGNSYNGGQSASDSLMERLKAGASQSKQEQPASASESLGQQDATYTLPEYGYPSALADLYNRVPDDMRDVAASAITSSGLGAMLTSKGYLNGQTSTPIVANDPRALEAMGKIMSVYASMHAPVGKVSPYQIRQLPLMQEAQRLAWRENFDFDVSIDRKTGFVDVYATPGNDLRRRHDHNRRGYDEFSR